MRITTRPSVVVAGVLSMLLVTTVTIPAAAAGPVSRDIVQPISVSTHADDTPTPSPSPSPTPTPTPTPEPRYRFTGHGTDHGVGLSQRGAAGRAADGQDYVQILRHYFYKTVIGQVASNTTIRALVVKSYNPRSTQTPLVKGSTVREDGDGHGMRWALSDVTDPELRDRSFSAGSSLVLKGKGTSGSWHLQVQDSTGKVIADFQDSNARVVVTPVAPGSSNDALGAIRVLLRPSTKYDTYMGSVRIGRSSGRIRMVNVAPIESFVRSVTPQELGPSNLIETLRAQAVVARSYFLAGLSTSTGFLSYDVESYRDSQSYKGIKGEKDKTTQATDDTAYEVVAFKGTAPTGVRRVSVLIDGDTDPAYYIARTFYHAVGGGATEASQNVFTGTSGKPGAKTSYLRGGSDVDEDGVPFDADASAYAWSTRSLTLTQFSAILAHDSRTDVGTLTTWPIKDEAGYLTMRAASIASDDPTPDPSNRGVSGRLTWVVLKGTRNGKPVTKQVAGWLFKSVFNSYRGSGDPLGSTMIFRAPAP